LTGALAGLFHEPCPTATTESVKRPSYFATGHFGTLSSIRTSITPRSSRPIHSTLRTTILISRRFPVVVYRQYLPHQPRTTSKFCCLSTLRLSALLKPNATLKVPSSVFSALPPLQPTLERPILRVEYPSCVAKSIKSFAQGLYLES
jgi:hypothetical protein